MTPESAQESQYESEKMRGGDQERGRERRGKEGEWGKTERDGVGGGRGKEERREGEYELIQKAFSDFAIISITP